MKKRIIAGLLVVVMLVLSLASCAPARFDFAGSELDACATFDLAAFKEKIAKIVVEDGDFTTNEEKRAEKVTESIYSSMITNIEKKVSSDESLKNKDSAISLRDVLYYNYYCTATVNEKEYVFYSAHMDTSYLTNSTYKADHVIKLPAVDEDDELDVALKAAIAALTEPTMKDKAYSTKSTKGTAISKGDTVVLSYTLTYTQTVESEEQKVNTTVNYSAPIVLDDTTDFGKKFFEEKTVCTVGNVATFGADKVKSFTVTEDGIEKTYSNITVKWIVEEAGAELVTFKHVLFGDDVDKDTTTKVKDDRTNVEIDLKGVELTYHVYPVYAVSIPEINATTILKDALGSSITAHSMYLFENEKYTAKDGDKTLTFEELIEALTEAYTELDTKQKAYDTAKSAVEKAGDKATDEQKKAETDAKAELDKAKKAVDDKIALIVGATSSDSADKPAAEAIVESYRTTVYQNLKTAYDTDITEKVGKEVYKAMKETVKVTSYPQSVVDELWHVYYERYEYLFWNESKEGTSYSNYSYYKGNFADYLAAELGAKATGGDLWGGVEGINKKLTEKVQKALDPIIIIYTVAKEFNKDSSVLTNLAAWVQADIDAGVYNSQVHRHDYESDEEYEEAKKSAEETKKENEEKALEDAKTFLYDNGAYDAFVKDLGDNYSALVDGYMMYGLWEVAGIGDIGLRATVQTNKLLGYLLSPVRTFNETMEQSEIAYVEVDGVKLIDFHNSLISYSTVEELPDEEEDKDDEKDDADDNKDDDSDK